MTTIRLEGLDFFAHHGYYDEERKVGNRYTVDVSVDLDEVNFNDDDLNHTVNYEDIYLTVSTVMSVSTKLLETLASAICQELLRQFPDITQVSTAVSKHNPPIKGVCNKATVSITQRRNNI
ncbi:MAG: dihydroneopterin aldolase [Reichenbachiella sp.]|uniref:dihydroneopterin aldolase n=1 Tax=Reichenbachiella sp. TaxID=2184521 RepID=UPI0032667B15